MEAKQSTSSQGPLFIWRSSDRKIYIGTVLWRKNYTQVIEINFILEPQAKKIFVQVNGAKEILRNITAYTKKEIYPHHTLIIFDEIQECPEARTMIKALVEDNTCDYIETGSLLGVRFKEIRSYPVGFEQIESVYPLDFEEFLWALQIPQKRSTTYKIVSLNKKPLVNPFTKQC